VVFHFHIQYTIQSGNLSFNFSICSDYGWSWINESLLTLNIIDEITETRGRGNKAIAQGVANILSGVFWYGWLRYVGTKPY
jgi:SulP family sulfate permease